MTQQDYTPVTTGGPLHQRRCAVRRGVVHYDDMTDVFRYALKHTLDLAFDAVGGNDGSDAKPAKIYCGRSHNGPNYSQNGEPSYNNSAQRLSRVNCVMAFRG